MPSSLFVAYALLGALFSAPREIDAMRLLDFSSQEGASASIWRPIHDGVMGGLSSGLVSDTEEGVRFVGKVSLENNGGFASFRASVPARELSAFDSLRLRVRGDGQIYKLSLRTSNAWDGVSWQTSFETEADTWTEVVLDFDAFQPTWRGRIVPNVPALDPSTVRQIGLLIADKQSGDFALELAFVEAVPQVPSAFS